MMSQYEEDEQESPKADADLTLGIGSLLSIFFGIVLICGIFFGFGYSMGRRNVPSNPSVAQKPSSNLPAPLDDPETTPAKPQTPDVSQPSPNQSRPAVTPPATSPDETATQPPAPAAEKPARPAHSAEPGPAATSLAAAPFTHRPPLPTKPHAGIAATPVPVPAPDEAAAPGHPIMVQIAAVSRQEDAETLAGALRKRGFTPQIRSGLADKFFHVQVGPFPDKTQAEAMKQHLLADGYNAIVK